MFYVYLIRSIKFPETIYIGYTTNINERLTTHNSGGSIHTSKDRPWELIVCISFKHQIKAIEFEKYLKSGSRFCLSSVALREGGKSILSLNLVEHLPKNDSHGYNALFIFFC